MESKVQVTLTVFFYNLVSVHYEYLPVIKEHCIETKVFVHVVMHCEIEKQLLSKLITLFTRFEPLFGSETPWYAFWR